MQKDTSSIVRGLGLIFVGLFSLTKFSKIFLSAGTMFLSMWVYALQYGWSYAAGFIGLIFIHEMGHYIAAKQKNLNVGLPTFIPFVGAWIELKEQPMNAETEAYVAYAGPLVGTFAAFACYYLAREPDNGLDSGLFMALAHAGFIINLFNLIPLSPLDGGRITAILSPRIWLIGFPLLIAVWFYSPSPLLIILALISLPQLHKAWKFDPQAPENKSYYDTPYSTRFEYTVLYLGLAIVLAIMLQHMG